MQGINLTEQGKPFYALFPQSVAGGVNAARFSMKHYAHATISIGFGVTDEAAEKIIVREANASSGGTATDIAFNVYKEETANGDTYGARTEIAATGLTPVATDNITYVIELDARELSDGFEWVEVNIQAGTGASVLASVHVALTGARYAHDQSETVLS